MPFYLTVADGYVTLTLNNAAVRIDGDRRVAKFTIAKIDRDAPLGYLVTISKEQFIEVALACSFSPNGLEAIDSLKKAIGEIVAKAPREHTRQTAQPHAIAPKLIRTVRPNRLGIIALNPVG